MTGLRKFLVFAALCGLAAFCAFSTSGCAAKNPAEGAAVEKDLNFLDSFSFDRKLSASLGAGQPQVDVLFPAAITLNNIPERMDKWLAKVEKFGGTVEIQAEPDSARGIISEIIGFFVKMYEVAEEKLIYAPAKDYNVLIRYKPGSGLVNRMSFLRKPAPAPVSAPAPGSAPVPGPPTTPAK